MYVLLMPDAHTLMPSTKTGNCYQ